MLILQRQLNESVTIGEDVSITVLAVQGANVRLAVDTPGHARAMRSELHDTILQQNLASTRLMPSRALDVAGYRL